MFTREAMTTDTNDTIGTDRDKRDGAQWSSVEEATELLHEERFREALIELRRVIEAEPKNPYAYYFLGIGLYEIGELEAARDAYQATLRLAPAYLGARVGLSNVLRMTGELRGAVREGLAALSQAPGDGDALHAVGVAYHARGDEAAAVKYLEAFLDTNPELEAAVEARTLLAAIKGEPNPND
jgi:tetratricopeptide (TPR) repeat protein